MILATLCDLARTIGCRPDQADDVVRSEPSARAALSRRGLFQAAGAVAAGVAFGDVPARSSIWDLFDAAHSRIDFGVVGANLAFGWSASMIVTSVDKSRGIITVESAPHYLL